MRGTIYSSKTNPANVWVEVDDTVAQKVTLGYTLPGDANLDNSVDGTDLNIVLSNYGTTSGATWFTGDFSGDGQVDGTDLNIVLSNYGSSFQRDRRRARTGRLGAIGPRRPWTAGLCLAKAEVNLTWLGRQFNCRPNPSAARSRVWRGSEMASDVNENVSIFHLRAKERKVKRSMNRTSCLFRIDLTMLGVAAIVLAGSSPAEAISWSRDPDSGSGDWSVASNWGGAVPTNSNWVYIDNGGTATIASADTCISFVLGSTTPLTLERSIKPGER